MKSHKTVIFQLGNHDGVPRSWEDSMVSISEQGTRKQKLGERMGEIAVYSCKIATDTNV